MLWTTFWALGACRSHLESFKAMGPVGCVCCNAALFPMTLNLSICIEDVGTGDSDLPFARVQKRVGGNGRWVSEIKSAASAASPAYKIKENQSF